VDSAGRKRTPNRKLGFQTLHAGVDLGLPGTSIHGNVIVAGYSLLGGVLQGRNGAV
jgi:hypothetical protein